MTCQASGTERSSRWQPSSSASSRLATHTELGAREGVLVEMERAGQLDRVARGLYRFRPYPTDARDELMAATLWPRRLGVICP